MNLVHLPEPMTLPNLGCGNIIYFNTMDKIPEGQSLGPGEVVGDR